MSYQYEDNNNKNNPMLKIGALWKNKKTYTDANGNQVESNYLSGNFGSDCYIYVTVNKYKKAGSKEPDFNILLQERKKKEEKKPQQETHNEFFDQQPKAPSNYGQPHAGYSLPGQNSQVMQPYGYQQIPPGYYPPPQDDDINNIPF